MATAKLKPKLRLASDSTAWRRVASSFSDHVDSDAPANAAVPRVLRALLAKIDAGEYQPGQKINTVDLANSLQLSRAPIREALHILAGKGIVKLLPDRGAIVRPFPKRRLIESFQVLACLFSFAMREAALRIHEGRNREIIQGHQAAIAEAALMDPPDFRFWFSVHDFLHDVAEMSGNELISEITFTLNLDLQARTFNEIAPIADNIAKYADTYRRLTEAVLEGDWRSAAAITDYHVDWQINLLKSLP